MAAIVCGGGVSARARAPGREDDAHLRKQSYGGVGEATTHQHELAQRQTLAQNPRELLGRGCARGARVRGRGASAKPTRISPSAESAFSSTTALSERSSACTPSLGLGRYSEPPTALFCFSSSVCASQGQPRGCGCGGGRGAHRRRRVEVALGDALGENLHLERRESRLWRALSECAGANARARAPAAPTLVMERRDTPPPGQLSESLRICTRRRPHQHASPTQSARAEGRLPARRRRRCRVSQVAR
jgi:hypothetical protein